MRLCFLPSQIRARGRDYVGDLAITLLAGVLGVGLGAMLARRNERASTADRLLAEAVNDLVAGVADVANQDGPGARARYASAVSRIALHASPNVVVAFRAFREEASTGTPAGRDHLLAAVQVARQELGHERATDDDVRVLLFGPDGTRRAPDLR